MKLSRPVQMGVDYYPEHWDPALWEQDARLMADSGVRIVRVGEFAWSRMEPADGQFDWEWLDQALDTLHRNGLEIIIGTPTMTPPRWLTEKCPDILPVLPSGQRYHEGVRGHRCYNSPSMRTYSARIVQKLSERYAKHPGVIGWQTDNEFSFTDCQCAACEEAFREWVRARYSTLEQVNQLWGTVVWSGEYSDWEQITPPYGGSTFQNPSYLLDYSRFQSDSIVAFQQIQVEIIRSNCPDHVITHNFHSYPQKADQYKIAKELDFASFDYYPNPSPNKTDTSPYSGALSLDLTRGIKRRNFWIMEQLSGPPGCWFPMWRTPRPGFLRAHSWQTIARGADAVVHFRWRSATVGAEQFWHGLIDHSNVPGRRFKEFQQLCNEVNRLGERLQGSTLRNEVAILHSHEQLYALHIQPQSEGLDYYENIKVWHRALTKSGISSDVIHSSEALDGYKIIIAPHLYLLDEDTAERLQAFAAAGGTLILTHRSGVKDDHNVCVMAPLPGLLSACSGVRVTEYDPVGGDTIMIRDDQGNSYAASQWADVLELDTAQPVAVYADQFYTESAAVTRNHWGEGEVYYIGTQPEEAYLRKLVRTIGDQLQLAGIEALPDGVQITTRTGPNGSFRFILNLSPEPVSIQLNASYTSALDGTARGPHLQLDGYDVEIVEIKA
ncbi:beta-galactosidase [Paenibacillus xylanilyticus]|uniref:Beta-galactosidase n=1 Tax=Paenibacillus xylanilyticus TaxID=248903 RepID=A0A7Y6BXQ2_9BACL|nr:beta-galactosidase [Paenibacillus xylanilyticus]NUU76503.1 beta-galactosidase [Paenibacillus xylanilyticus]